MDKQLEGYRKFLIAADQKAQEDFDKTVLSLSGGALGISFAFVKDIVGTKPVINSSLLLAAWIAWGISVCSVLFLFYLSQHALRHAIKQIDANEIYKQAPGGLYDRVTSVLNALGGILFFVGVILMVIFVSENLR